jgi:hypothetical protein
MFTEEGPDEKVTALLIITDAENPIKIVFQ